MRCFVMLKSFGLVLFVLLTYPATFSQEASKSKEKKGKEWSDKVYKRLLNVNFGNDKKSYLGIRIREVTKENFSEYGLSGVRGAIVEEVVEDSPAAKAGLKDGDVIVRFNGESVTSARKLKRLVSEVAPDHKADITIVRNGNEQNLRATIGKSRSKLLSRSYSFPQTIPSVSLAPSVPKVLDLPNIKIFPEGHGQSYTLFSSDEMGIGFSSLTKQLGEHFGVLDGKGLLVHNVYENSPADKVGLKAGDVIVAVDGKEFTSGSDMIRMIRAKKGGTSILTIVRNKSRISLTGKLMKKSNNVLRERIDLLDKIKERMNQFDEIQKNDPV